jgi:hypothetical protein
MDWYGFQSIKSVFSDSHPKVRFVAYSIYWAFTLFVVVFFVMSVSMNLREHGTTFTRFLFGVFVGVFISKLLFIIFIGLEDLFRGAVYLYSKFFVSSNTELAQRRKFFNTVFLGISGLPFFAVIYGMVRNKYNYKIHKVTIRSKNLPDAFNGFKIVQISDIHSGSFDQIEPLEEAVKMINRLNADIFVFTGDLVNNVATEMDPYIEIFKNVKSKMGNFSITGNHDYGDYITWDSEEKKKQNFKDLMSHHRSMNWDLLMNEHRILEKNGEKIALLGIENWGAKIGFPKYGKMEQAYKGTEQIPFKVLLSHDPSSWDAMIRKDYKDIDLTLSGHTHGMQFGVETKWFRFSPVQFVYNQWAGLYHQSGQYINVNRGFGFIGYPGRVGILPEITEITLVKS